MIKLLGKVIGHSFGLFTMVLTVTIGGFITAATHGSFIWLYVLTGIYTGGYALLPLTVALNKLLEGNTIRREIKKEMNTGEWQKDFRYEMSKKTQKKLDKIAIKKAKRTENVTVQEMQEDTHI